MTNTNNTERKESLIAFILKFPSCYFKQVTLALVAQPLLRLRFKVRGQVKVKVN